ncbi:MAG TPA: hypothetical protein VNM91_05865, partial [Dehalococcoidia bacterium]|nr:hypothetical protein [Dehalococcoidia bacterium]
IVAPEDFYAFHLALIKHGRRTCTAQRPRCPECVPRDLCPSATKYHPELRAARRGISPLTSPPRGSHNLD